MTLQLSWTDADITSAYWAYMRRNPWLFVRYFRYPIVAIAVSAVIIVQYPQSWQVVGGLLLFDAGTIAYEMLLSHRNVRKRFKNWRFWQDFASATIDGHSLRLKGQTAEQEIAWSRFSDIFESKRLFLLTVARKGILFLPKSGMNDSEIFELRTLIVTYAKGRVKLLDSR
jgi:hypothetical protein